jgi:DNA-binding transcriptional LysR family regulator
MYIQTFKIFCDLAETQSFSKAAALNSITQSAVSQQIRAVEKRFEVTLIERARRHFSLTPEGKVFLNASREILEVYDTLGDRLHTLRDVVAGELRLASIYSIGLHELPPRPAGIPIALPGGGRCTWSIGVPRKCMPRC